MRYRRATSVPDAIGLLADGAIPIAGGTIIVPDAIRRGEGPDVVDISRIEALHQLTAGPIVRIGAMVTIARIASAPELAAFAALKAAAAEVANPNVRLRGTLGGNLAYRAPYSNLPPALIALDAMVVIADASGERTVAMEELARTGPPAGSLIVGVDLVHRGQRSAFRKFAWRRSSGRTLVTVAIGGSPEAPRFAVGGLCRYPVRLPRVEQLLTGRPWTTAVADEAARCGADEAPADVREFPPADYRRRLVAAGIRSVLHAASGAEGSTT
jgi:aerobic carbon-monoxide dehydrogenase medium subunit